MPQSAPYALFPFRKYFALILAHIRQPIDAAGNILRQTIMIPHRAKRQRLALLQEGEPSREIAARLSFPQKLDRFKQRRQQRLEHTARADDPSRDAVDARIEVIQPDAHS